jgi:SAM-dependent methyltransferase
MNEQQIRGVRESYDRLSDEYARRIYGELAHKPLDRELLDRFARDTSGGLVCDVGCGPGHVARYVYEAGAKKVTGLDLSLRMVEIARELNPAIEFEVGDMLALPFANDSLAGIAAFYAIVNIPETSLPTVVGEMYRVLRKGGLLLLAFHIGGDSLFVDELWGHRVTMNFYFFKTEAIVRLLAAAGFSIEDTIEREPYAPEVEHQSRRAYIFARKPA